MRRTTIIPRADWRPGLRKYSFGADASPAGERWSEEVRYDFSAQQIDLIESVADEVHVMVRGAVRHVMEERLLPRLGVQGDIARLTETTWHEYWRGGVVNDRAGGLAGRLTFAYDGRDSLKLLSCNYDVPDGLFIAAIIQRNWLELQGPRYDQFNGLHVALVERWEEIDDGRPLHLTCLTPDPAREGELVYLAATANEAGLPATLLPLEDIRWDGSRFRDHERAVISRLVKLYPWSAMAEDAYARSLRLGAMGVVEPAWRWLMSHHGLLPLLWQLHPRHPNLCRAVTDPAALSGCDVVLSRGFFGLDHARTRIMVQGQVVSDSAPGEPAGGHEVWMEMPPLFEHDKGYAVIDAWIVGEKCMGMSVRESHDPRLGPDSRVVPHIFRG